MHYDLVVNKSLKQSLSQSSESLSIKVTSSSVDVSILIMPPASAVTSFSFFAAEADSFGLGEPLLSSPM